MRSPDTAPLLRTQFFVALPKKGEEYDQVDDLSLLHITGVKALRPT